MVDFEVRNKLIGFGKAGLTKKTMKHFKTEAARQRRKTQSFKKSIKFAILADFESYLV